MCHTDSIKVEVWAKEKIATEVHVHATFRDYDIITEIAPNPKLKSVQEYAEYVYRKVRESITAHKDTKNITPPYETPHMVTVY